MQNDRKAIAVYIPKWLYKNDVGITIFVNGLFETIKNHPRYRLFILNPFDCIFKNKKQAQDFVNKNNIVLVIYHGSRDLPMNRKIEKGLDFLEECVTFLNKRDVHIADDKIKTKKLLESYNIPTLSHKIISSKKEFLESVSLDELYVAKPHNRESGFGVKLIKKTESGIKEYLNGKWKNLLVLDTKKGIKLLSFPSLKFIFILSVFIVFLFSFLSIYFKNSNYLIFVVLILIINSYLIPKIQHNFTYNPLMLEPFFGDNLDEFYCLRCTVIGDKVVESAKKSNLKNVTPNISHGGKASKIELTKEQENFAILANKAIGAEYSGIDFLVKDNKTVVCEVNVGPIGLYCEQTEIDVGKILAEHAIKKCEEIYK